jgi:superfamily II DNA or RNA helicase
MFPNSRTTIVYNLFELLPGLYGMNAFLVQQEREGALTHIVQKAGPHLLDSFAVEAAEQHRRLLRIAEQIQPKALEQYFNAKAKKPRPMAELYEDEKLKKQIDQYVQRRIDELLSLVQKYGFAVSWDAERRSLVKDMVLQIADTPLQPRLSFSRLPEGVSYRLKLAEADGKVWNIQSREVASVCNQPAWIFADYRLYRVEHINGNMVLPFRNKNEVRIPKSSVKTYFQRFILKVAAKADIEADGFEIIRHNELKTCRLEAVHDLFGGHWTLAVYMVYPGADFACRDARQERTSLEFGNGDDIRILKVQRRRDQEERFLDALLRLGLVAGNGSQFALPYPDEDSWKLLQWLCEHRRTLEAEGFTVSVPETEQGKLLTEPAHLEWNTQQGNDWFDLNGEVRVGPHSIPFLLLASFIREGNRLYPLPNGEVFLIPAEWMSRYKGLAQMGRKQGEQLRIAKNQIGLLQDAGLIGEEALPNAPTNSETPLPAGLRADLRPYQLQGFQWLARLYSEGLGACLADDMGLGKTLQTIAVLLYAKDQKPATNAFSAGQLSLFQPAGDADFLRPLQALVVLPASLVFNWQRELAQFAPGLNVYVHTGAGRHKDIRLLARFDVVLTTYQTALRDGDLLLKTEWEYIVLDESQQIKNKDSQVFKVLNSLSARHKVSLSGTPIENSLSDLWSQMQFINPELLGTHAFFKKAFILPIEKQQDEAQKNRLRTLVQPYLLRRTKEEVAKDLPPLTERVFYSEMTAEQAKLYESEKSKARNFLLENYQSGDGRYQMVVHQTLMRLRQLVNHPRMILDDYRQGSGKFQDVLEEWEVIRRSGHKVLMFSSFVRYLDLFKEAFSEAGQPVAWLSGELSSAQRQAEIARFQNDPQVQAFLISIKAGGTGLNLTAADYVFVLDPWWNPFVEQQAIARAHRIGQDKNVIALKFITRGSIEEKILVLQDRKKQLAEDIFAHPEKLSLQRDELAFLLE